MDSGRKPARKSSDASPASAARRKFINSVAAAAGDRKRPGVDGEHARIGIGTRERQSASTGFGDAETVASITNGGTDSGGTCDVERAALAENKIQNP